MNARIAAALSAWSGYWFREAPLLDLAMLRIIAVGTQFALMTLDPRYGMANLIAIDRLPDEFYQPLPFLELLLLPFGPEALGLRTISVLHVVALCSGFFALIGLATRVALPVFAVTTAIEQLWVVSHGDIHHPEAVMIVTLCVLALAPAGGALSIDAWLRRRDGRAADSSAGAATSWEAKWPILLVQWFFGLMYLSASYAKLAVSDFRWPNGITLQYYMAMDGLRWGAPLGLPLSKLHEVALAGQWGILLFQSTFFLSMILPKLKLVYVPIGMVMHFTIYFMLGAPFWQWSALYLVFIPWTALLTYFGWLPHHRSSAMSAARASVA
jgi:hypothetical protein